MKYIRNNKLFLGTKFLTIKNNLDDIIQYIYLYYYLNYDKMEKIYEHIELENNYGHAMDFKNNSIEDNKYIYKRYKLDCDISNFKNKKLIQDLNNYLILNKTKDLKLNNINKIKLINDSDICNNPNRAHELDWKLHCWHQYIINNNNKSLRIHDLIKKS